MVTSPGTFRRAFSSRASEEGLRGRSAYNEIEKVVEKGHFTRHLPEVGGHREQKERPCRTSEGDSDFTQLLKVRRKHGNPAHLRKVGKVR